MRVRLVVLVCLSVLAVAAASAGAAAPPTVLVIGDSVATGMYWHDDSIAVMQNQLGVYWDVAICRTIDGTSCPFDGERAPTLIQAGRGARHRAADRGRGGRATTIPADMFATEVDRAMSALTAAGATHVLWLTMRESRAPYPTLNALLEQATARWPQLQLVDWNDASASHPSWFQTDDVHLTPEGGLAMAHLAHAAVMQSCRSAPRARNAAAAADSAALTRRSSAPRAARRRTAGASRAAARRWFPPARGRDCSRPARHAHRRRSCSRVTDADGTTANLQVLER